MKHQTFYLSLPEAPNIYSAYIMHSPTIHPFFLHANKFSLFLSFPFSLLHLIYISRSSYPCSWVFFFPKTVSSTNLECLDRERTKMLVLIPTISSRKKRFFLLCAAVGFAYSIHIISIQIDFSCLMMMGESIMPFLWGMMHYFTWLLILILIGKNKTTFFLCALFPTPTSNIDIQTFHCTIYPRTKHHWHAWSTLPPSMCPSYYIRNLTIENTTAYSKSRLSISQWRRRSKFLPIKRTFSFQKRERDGFTRVALVLIFEMGLYVSIEGDTYIYVILIPTRMNWLFLMECSFD